MNSFKYISTIALLLASFSVFSQNRNWTTEITKDGQTTVKHETVKENGGTHIYYMVERNVNTSIDELDDYFSNSANHKNFLASTPVSKEIKKISDDEWLSYYYFDAPWPMPDSDVVVKIKRIKNDNKLVFTASAIPNDYQEKDVERMVSYKVVYQFEKMNQETTKVTFNADYIPVGTVPVFLLKSWFPKGPAKIVSKLGSME